MTRHDLKTWPDFFQAITDGRKTFEVRKNDRGFQVGDVLLLREYDPASNKYTGRKCERQVSYMLTGPAFGIEAGYSVMAIG